MAYKIASLYCLFNVLVQTNSEKVKVKIEK